MSNAFCSDCGQPVELLMGSSPYVLCPHCGSRSGNLTISVSDAGRFTEHGMIAQRNDGELIGFVESDLRDLNRRARLDADGAVCLDLRGLAPQNEQDRDVVCALLVQALTAMEMQANLVGPGEGDEDCVMTLRGQRLAIQVVRALTAPTFWRELTKRGQITDLRLTPDEAARALRTAIEHKLTVPPQHRPTMILLLDAYRLPALALGPVSNRFRETHGNWASSLGFRSIYIVGPQSEFVTRLDQALQR